MARGRKRAPGSSGRRDNGHTRDCESFSKKLDIINYVRDHGMPATLNKFYSHLTKPKRESKRKRIYDWIKDREKIESKASSSATAHLKADRKKGTATTLSAIAEEGLVEWVNTLRGEGVPISRLMLQLQAVDIAHTEGIPEGVFEGSWCWQQGFLSRHGLSLRAKTRQGQKSPEAMEEAARAFWCEVERTKLELGVDKIYNADQSGICFEYLPKQTINKKGAKTVWVRCGGKDKDRLTGMFLADSTGKQYDPFYVVKTDPSKIPERAAYNYVAQHGFGDTLWRQMKSIQTDLQVQIYGNSSAWWNSDLSVAFLDYHFADRDEASPVLLLWDDFSAHWTKEAAQHAEILNIHLVKVPPGLTSVCQPADISWFRPLKQRLRKRWVDYIAQQLRTYSSSESSAKFVLSPPSRNDAIHWATTAWRELGTQVIRSGFKRQMAEPAADVPQNIVIQQLERLHAVEETVSDADDVVQHFLDGQEQ